jgi:ubiquinone/menaquinone biosynthesis C-methylase UbiE
MGAPQSDMHFKLMALTLKIRDIFKPPRRVLEEADINAGNTVLDFGCGPGSYSLAAAELVGKQGKVYSWDIHPMAIKSVNRRARSRELTNIEAVFSDDDTGFPDKCMDVILIYDVFHELDKPEKYLQEFHRLLKDDGIVSFNDHHLRDEDIVSGMTRDNYFRLAGKGKKTHTFKKAKQ